MTDDIREIARKRIKARRDFWQMVAVFVIVSIILVAVWAASGVGYFWPLWPMLGFAIATLFSALATFGPLAQPISEAHIDAEIKRMGGGPAVGDSTTGD